MRERIRFLCRTSLLIVDEIGYLPVIPGGGNLFFQLVNARYERGAMILTSNRGFAEWGEVFGDPVVATALLDRLLHHAVVIQIEGSSYRLRQHADLVPEHIRSKALINPPLPAPPRAVAGGRPKMELSITLPVITEPPAGEFYRGEMKDMKVRHWKQLSLPLREPLGPCQALAFRTVTIAARVVGDAGRTTIIALLDMATERRRPAGRDGAHDATLDAPEMTGMRLSERFAMAAEDIRHLQSRSHGARSAGWHDLQAEPIERAWCVADGLGGDPCVARRA